MIYEALNIFFFLFHSALILFNTFGWLFPRLRKWNLLTLLLTALSWFFLGIWYGWGYCVCTDWHWDVRRELGYDDASDSYIHFLILKLTGIDFSERLLDVATVVVFFLSLVGSVWVNVRGYGRRRGI